MISLRYSDFIQGYVREEFESLVAQLRGFLAVGHNEDGTVRTTTSELGLVPVATIAPYAGATAPTGWLLCDGSQVSRVTYKGLYEIITTTYGAGDGSTTFNLPDLRQRFPLGKAASGTGAVLGSTGGAIDHTHTGPSHTHTTSDHTHTTSDHVHTGPSHTHTGPSHTHTIASTGGQTTDGEAAHTHDVTGSTAAHSGLSTVTVDANEDGVTLTVSDDGHVHSADGTLATGAGSSHSHTITGHDHGGATGAEGTGVTGASGTGNTGASGAGNTGASGAGNTGASGTGATSATNPPFVSLNYIIYTGVEA